MGGLDQGRQLRREQRVGVDRHLHLRRQIWDGDGQRDRCHSRGRLGLDLPLATTAIHDEAHGASAGDVEAVESLRQSAHGAHSRRIGGGHHEYAVGGVQRHRQDVVQPAAAVQHHMVELVPQHGDDLASGDLCHRLAHLAVIRSGQQGDSTRQRIHDL